MNKLQERAIKASMRFLEAKGYDVIREHNGYIVANDNGGVVIASVKVRNIDDGFGEIGDVDRSGFEREGILFLVGHPEYVDIPLRFDELALVVMGNDRAILRHHINCLEKA